MAPLSLSRIQKAPQELALQSCGRRNTARSLGAELCSQTSSKSEVSGPSANMRPQYVTPQFSLFPKFSSSFLYRKCSTRYLEALRGEGLGCRTPFRTPNLRTQRANVRHHGVIPWVLLGCSWAAPVLLGHAWGPLFAPGCSLLAPGCSCEAPGPSFGSQENDQVFSQGNRRKS